MTDQSFWTLVIDPGFRYLKLHYFHIEALWRKIAKNSEKEMMLCLKSIGIDSNYSL